MYATYRIFRIFLDIDEIEIDEIEITFNKLILQTLVFDLFD